MRQAQVVAQRLLEVFPRLDEAERRLQRWPGIADAP
jgi:hypothetical protein